MSATFKQLAINVREALNSLVGVNAEVAKSTEALLPLQVYAGRNLLINSNFHPDAVINQRLFVGGQPADEVYGYDRWKGTVGGVGLTQVVEAGSFKPSSEYTLSGTNVTTAKMTSPASGDWAIDVPVDADLVQLELGSEATEFEYVDPATQLAKCQRYDEKGYAHIKVIPAVTELGLHTPFAVTKRGIPSIVSSDVLGTVISTSIKVSGVYYTFGTPTSGNGACTWTADAEL